MRIVLSLGIHVDGSIPGAARAVDFPVGGGEPAGDFLHRDRIDELDFGPVPVPIDEGEGIPLFPSGFFQRDFSLVENKTPSKGTIPPKYRRARSKVQPKS
jgi:dihydrofolate reductase